MDFISVCLDIVPVPALKTAWSVFKLICQSVDAYDTGKQRIKTLAYSFAQLLLAVNASTKERKVIEPQLSIHIRQLES